MSRDMITKDELRALVRAEKLTPLDIFDEDALKDIIDKARSEGYADARSQNIADAWRQQGSEKKSEDGQAEDDGPGKYLDPKRNPLIKLSGE